MAETLYPLALLACPVGMGLMMWLMMRGGRSNTQTPSPNRDVEVEQLRREVAALRGDDHRVRTRTAADEQQG
jgi:hypothetical protein